MPAGSYAELLAVRPDLLGVLPAEVVPYVGACLESEPGIVEPARTGKRLDVPKDAIENVPSSPIHRRVMPRRCSGTRGCPTRAPFRSRRASTATMRSVGATMGPAASTAPTRPGHPCRSAARTRLAAFPAAVHDLACGPMRSRSWSHQTRLAGRLRWRAPCGSHVRSQPRT